MTARTMASRNPLDKVRQSLPYPEARVALLRQKGISLASIAADLGVDRSLVAHVNALRKRSKSTARVRAAIARALGMSIKEAFPDLKDAAA